MEPRKRHREWVWGLFLIALGVFFLADRLIVLPDAWADFHWWGVISILVGIVLMVVARRADELGNAVMITLFGIWFVVASNELYGLTWKNSWPLALVAAGVGTVTRGIAANWLPDAPEAKKERHHA